MKTKSDNNQSSELKNRPEQLSTEQTSNDPKATDSASPGELIPNGRRNAEPLPRLDFAKRHANRQLPTEAVVSLLRTNAPDFFAVAEVVGKWVWVQFAEKQPREVTSLLAQLGFHWNNKRQVWQHPCGLFAPTPSNYDPRERYGSYFPADTQAA